MLRRLLPAAALRQVCEPSGQDPFKFSRDLDICLEAILYLDKDPWLRARSSGLTASQA
jgi:hypothetical protein